MNELAEFTEACIEALYFTDTGEGEQPPVDAELSEDTRLDLEADCRSFWRRYGCFITTKSCADYWSVRNCVHSLPQQAGHDFWLTRNGHGAGFWDGDWPACYEDMFTKGSECYGTFETYLGDDGLIWA